MATIDAHHHLWQYSPEKLPWISNDMKSLQRDFLLADLQQVLADSKIDGAVAVQAQQNLTETEWLLGVADHASCILGVVGWVPLIDADVREHLEKLAPRAKLVGVRHVLHDETDDAYMLREDFNRGISLLKDFNLAYDILIFERHLPQTIKFVDRHPQQRFVLDHIAKPRIRDGVLSPWQENIRELAKRGNVYCKLSGIVTEADWKNWTVDSLRPYVDTVLEAFGPGRLMFGSDWPVVLLASGYGRWVETMHDLLADISKNEKVQILGETAMQVYRL